MEGTEKYVPTNCTDATCEHRSCQNYSGQPNYRAYTFPDCIFRRHTQYEPTKGATSNAKKQLHANSRARL